MMDMHKAGSRLNLGAGKPEPNHPYSAEESSFSLHRGESLTILEGSDESDGERVVIRIDLEPGTVIGVHAHPIQEVFECLEGRVAFHLDGRTLEIRAGNTVTVAPGRLHGFRNTTTQLAALRMVGTPGTETEYGLRVAGLLARDGFGIKRRGMSLQHLLLSAVVLDRVGLSFPPLPRWLFRLLFGSLAVLGRWGGHEKDLIRRYPEYTRFLQARNARRTSGTLERGIRPMPLMRNGIR